MGTSHATDCTTVETKTHYCRCGCGGELPPFVDRASRATRYLPGHTSLAFLDRFAVDAESGCWIWQGPPASGGHGQVAINHVTVTAHRAVYEHFNGPLAEGMTLHHLCSNRLCVNPAHMQEMTHSEHRRHHALKKWAAQKADPSLHIIGPASPSPAPTATHRLRTSPPVTPRPAGTPSGVAS